jgi:hypothetical protein
VGRSADVRMLTSALAVSWLGAMLITQVYLSRVGSTWARSFCDSLSLKLWLTNMHATPSVLDRRSKPHEPPRPAPPVPSLACFDHQARLLAEQLRDAQNLIAFKDRTGGWRNSAEAEAEMQVAISCVQSHLCWAVASGERAGTERFNSQLLLSLSVLVFCL